MKRMLAFVLLLSSVGVTAQRGGAHGGSVGHASPSFRGNSFGARRQGYAAGPRAASPRSTARYTTGGFAGGRRVPAGAYAGRPIFYSRAGSESQGLPVAGARRGYFNRFGGNRLGFGYPGFGLLSYSYLGDFLDEPDFLDEDSPGWTGSDAQYPNQEPEPAELSYPPFYAPSAPPQGEWGVRTAPDPAPEEDIVTIVFKDGRPSEQIRNYALTRTTLYITGQHIREIPMDEIDLPATQQLNRASGIDFRLPERD